MKKLVVFLAVAAALAFVFAPALFAPNAGANGTVHHYVTPLRALNNSGVSGEVRMDLQGDTLTVTVTASGLEANQTHMQHIHAIDHGNSTCPPASADTNGDGIVSFTEGLPFYGPVRLPLTPYPSVGSSGAISFTQTYTVDPHVFLQLPTKVVVLHGLSVGNAYVPSVPVACGQIRVLPGA